MNPPDTRDQSPSLCCRETSGTELLLVTGHTDKDVKQHPEVKSRLAHGCTVRRAGPRIVEDEGAKCLVILDCRAEDDRVPLTKGHAVPEWTG